jgi:ribosome-interacting GTPase 1
MPANLPPQYHAAEQRYRQAKTIPEKLAALQEMLALMPKHKGTDHLQAELRSRMAKLLDEMARPTGPKGARWNPFHVPSDGAGQVLLIGVPNAGKSRLFTALTGAPAKVAPYPFTTTLPAPGILTFGGLRIQLVDSPPIDPADPDRRLYGLLRNADVLLAVLDLSTDAVQQLRDLLGLLAQWSFTPLGPQADPEERSPLAKPLLFAATKADLPGALDGFELLQSELARYVPPQGGPFPLVLVSPEEDVGLDELAQALFDALGVIRVYTKRPGEDPDLNDPMVLPKGSRVLDAAISIHKDLARTLKYAVLWGPGRPPAQRVGRDHPLRDGDIIEVHVR